MANILICADDKQFQKENKLYFQQLQPDFIKRGHPVELTAPERTWEQLLAAPVDILLLLARSRQSRSWEAARRIREDWPAERPRPLVLALVERQFEDFGKAEQSYLSQFLGHTEYRELWLSLDREVKSYCWEPEYLGLWNDFLPTFDWSGRHIVFWVEQLLFYRHFKPERVKAQIAAVFPAKETWTLAEDPIRIPYHPLLELRIHTPGSERTIPVAWSWENKVWLLDNERNFWQFVQDEQLQLAVESEREDILTIFSVFQQRKIVYRVFPAEATPAQRRELLQEYAQIVAPPVYEKKNGKHQVRFWAIDIASPGGNLEEWLLIQQGADFFSQAWVRVADFGRNFKSKGNQMYFLCYDIPPDLG